MKATSADKQCIGCGLESDGKTSDGLLLCPTCRSVIDLFKNSPQSIKHLAQLAGTDFYQGNENQKEQELPDVLDGVRYRTTDREKNTWYVSVSELDGNPVEIFASTAFDRDQHLQSRISNLTTITRLISLILRHVFMGERLTLEKTLTQLNRSSRQPNDLPEMLGKILANYKDETTKEPAKESTIP